MPLIFDGGTGVLVGSLGVARLLTTVGRDHMLPSVFAYVHPTLGTPLVSTIFLGVITGAEPSPASCCSPCAPSCQRASASNAGKCPTVVAGPAQPAHHGSSSRLLVPQHLPNLFHTSEGSHAVQRR